MKHETFYVLRALALLTETVKLYQPLPAPSN